MASFRNILGLRERGIISIVGAGGKTTLLFALSHEIAAAGETVLTTTTTKIFVPSEEQSSQVIISAYPQQVLEKARLLTDGQRHVTAGRALIPPENKLAGFTSDDIAELERGNVFRWILVEADGAKHRPLKAPAAHEPVIPPCSQWVIAVVGLDVVGQPLTEEWVFRSHLYGTLTGLKSGEAITEHSVAVALTHGQGIMKGCPPGAARLVFLNKADTTGRREAGRRIAELLKKAEGIRPDRIIIASLREGTETAEWHDLTAGREQEKTAGTISKAPTAGIILAAGMSTRMGKTGTPKQLLEAGGKPLLAWVVEAAIASELARVILVLGHEAGKILAALGPLAGHRRIKTIINDRYADGMASSLQAGLLEVRDEFPSVMFLLGDQPLVGTETINLLLDRFRESDKDICVPMCGGKRGNPVIFSCRHYHEILEIRGDRGAREIIDRYPDAILPAEISDPRCFLDIDNTEDAQKLPALEGRASR
ncbi:MAG: putative selenium-dependent hydroxylase accessory protein YqeC [Deltaproteobacteria bacterium]|nr:putative selenium-dependent hydroxylase accessory protein YqeC [Deltaproteobacteria bacterium]